MEKEIKSKVFVGEYEVQSNIIAVKVAVLCVLYSLSVGK